MCAVCSAHCSVRVRWLRLLQQPKLTLWCRRSRLPCRKLKEALEARSEPSLKLQVQCKQCVGPSDDSASGPREVVLETSAVVSLAPAWLHRAAHKSAKSTCSTRCRMRQALHPAEVDVPLLAGYRPSAVWHYAIQEWRPAGLSADWGVCRQHCGQRCEGPEVICGTRSFGSARPEPPCYIALITAKLSHWAAKMSEKLSTFFKQWLELCTCMCRLQAPKQSF
jgi:hypothetical protein